MSKSVKLSSGYTVPSIGFGFWQVPPEEAAEVAYQGLKLGYRLLDSAQDYGNEAEVAEGIARWIAEDPVHNKREDLVFTTKIWNTNQGYDRAKKSLEESLEKVKSIGYIDILLIHTSMTDDRRRHETWQVLQEAVESGKVRSIGVSNYGIKHLRQLLAYSDLKIKPVINQLELHPWAVRKELTDFCKAEGIVPEAYCPLTTGRRIADPRLAELAKKYGKTPAQVLIRWSIQMGFIPLPKSTHKGRLLENLDVYDFELSAEDVSGMFFEDTPVPNPGWNPLNYPLDGEK